MKRSAWTSRLGLPLLGKELLEQAARKRTYVLRVVYAALLFIIACLLFHELLSTAARSPLAVLGRGREMFYMLVALQFAGIYLFMPALTCGVLTQEKENNSLPLLFLTKLGPWTIVFEKLGSRIIPMLCFLLLPLPLLAYSYSLGGLAPQVVLAGEWMLFVAILQTGTVALMCSAWHRTTVRSFIRSYILVIAQILGPACLWLLLTMGDLQAVYQFAANIGISEPYLLFPLFPVVIFFSADMGTGTIHFASAVVRSLPTLFVCGGCLLLARAFVIRRAFAAPEKSLAGSFRALDRYVLRRSKGKPVLEKSAQTGAAELPVSEPIAWRESSKTTLGKNKHAFALVMLLEAVLIPVCSLLSHVNGRPSLWCVSLLLLVLWIVGVLTISVMSASLIAGERTHQTLDVLCTLPISGREILLQKFQGVRRAMQILAAPLLTVHLLQAWWESQQPTYNRFQEEFSAFWYVCCAVLAIAVYLPLAAWFSLLVGLRSKTHARAIIAAFGGLVAWCIAPMFLIYLPLGILFGPPTADSAINFAMLFSPAAILFASESNALHHFSHQPGLAVLLNFAAYAIVLAVIRAACLHNADRWLGRAETWGAGGAPVDVIYDEYGRPERSGGPAGAADRASEFSAVDRAGPPQSSRATSPQA